MYVYYVETYSLLDQYTDAQCMWFWIYKLKNDWVCVAIDKLTGVMTLKEEMELIYLPDKPNSNGGMRAKLSDFHTKVKACSISLKD